MWKIGRRQTAILVFFPMLFGMVAMGTFGQDTGPRQSVLVIPAANRSGETALDSVGTTASQTIEISLEMLDAFEVQPVAGEAIPPGVVAGDPDALGKFARAQDVDYIMFGWVSKDLDERIVIEMAVWDRNADSVALQARQTASSLFDTFSVADDLAVRFLSAFSGQRIAFGSIELEPAGWDEGSYTVIVDGMEVAADTAVVPQVLIGERTVEVVANNGPEVGAVLVSRVVTVREAESASLAFTFPAPPPVPPEREDGILGEVPAEAERSRAIAFRIQSGGGFLGAAGLDIYPGRGRLRTGLAAGAAFGATDPIPAITVAIAIEPSIGRVVMPIGLSSYVTADAEAVTAAAGLSLGVGIRFDRVLHEIFLDNLIYFNSYPTAGLPLVYMPVIGVRL